MQEAVRTSRQVLEEHLQAGRFIEVVGINTFVLEKGEGDAVFCIHGVPTSSYLYRKVINELAELGLRGVAIDLPGLGFSDRPRGFDYTFSHFADFCAQAAEKLGLRRFHLLVHDIGGPVGFALAARHPDKIQSISILNTMIDVVNFKKPLPMRPFENPVLGNLELATITHLSWQLMFKAMGVSDSSQIPVEEINAYVDLLKHNDGGKAFLKIMQNFEKSEAFREECYRAVQQVPYPVQLIWGAEDPALTYAQYGEQIRELAGLSEVHRLPAKHFLQEEQAETLAKLIASQAENR